MPTRTSSPVNPLRILLAAVVCCILLGSLLVAGGVYWVASAIKPHRGATAELPRSEPRLKPALPASRTRAVFAAGGVVTKNAILSDRTNNKALPGEDIFRDLVIPRVKITIPTESLPTIQQRGNRKYVRATISEGDKVYTNVAIRLKGGPGSWRPFHDRPAFTINFDKFAPDQEFHGLKKIHLNNSVQDSSYIEEKISRELFEAAGVPVPRAGNAIVTVNGREMGMYVLVEGINKQFLKRYFKDTHGNVFDGHSGTDVTSRLPINAGDTPPDRSGLVKLVAAMQEPVRGGARLAALEQTLDVDRFLSYMAMEMILWHWDGYTMARNNWRVFHDRDAGRMVFIPQGVDQMFNQNGSVLPDNPNGMVAQAVLSVPELRKRYLDRVTQITTNVFNAQRIGTRITEVAEAIEDALAEEGDEEAATSHRSRANSLRKRVAARARYLQREFFTLPAAEFDPSGTMALEGWEPRIDVPEATLARISDGGGNYLLHIKTENSCTASWRTSRVLDRGTYRFEARIKTKGVLLNPDDKRAGAGLRISRFRDGQKNEGDQDWKDVHFEFPVNEDQTDVELVCELRADEGEVWFDAKSLKLKRL